MAISMKTDIGNKALMKWAADMKAGKDIRSTRNEAAAYTEYPDYHFDDGSVFRIGDRALKILKYVGFEIEEVDSDPFKNKKD